VRSQAFVSAVGCALLSASCTDGGTGVGNGACGSFGSELRIEDKLRQESTTFISGEPITFNLRITNHGDSPATLSYPDGCTSIRLVVSYSRGRDVFDNMPAGIVCTAQVRTFTYAPREAKEFPLVWNQTPSSGGAQVPPGGYTVDARDRSLECAGDLDRGGAFAIQ